MKKRTMVLPLRKHSSSSSSSSSSKVESKWAIGAVAVWIALWYTASLVTLFMNKYILSYLKADSSVLALVQMVSTAFYGAAKVYGPDIMGAKEILRERKQRWAGMSKREFAVDMCTVGLMRFATVILGLIALSNVAVSFVETIKASAPFFTVFVARIMLREVTDTPVILTLIPVASGLAMAASAELSFNFVGFFAACMCNCIDCVQNVFSKKLLSGRYTSVELQFYTSAAALLIQFPLFLYRALFSESSENGTIFDRTLLCCLLIDGMSYHLQSVFAYKVMSYISPVTMSVINTAKRAVLICLSVAAFHNEISSVTFVGTVICIMGVFLYNYVKQGGSFMSIFSYFFSGSRSSSSSSNQYRAVNNMTNGTTTTTTTTTTPIIEEASV